MKNFYTYIAIFLFSLQAICCNGEDREINIENELSINIQITKLHINEDTDVHGFIDRFSEIMSANAVEARDQNLLIHISLFEFARGQSDGSRFLVKKLNRWSFNVAVLNGNLTVDDVETNNSQQFPSIDEFIVWMNDQADSFKTGNNLRFN